EPVASGEAKKAAPAAAAPAISPPRAAPANANRPASRLEDLTQRMREAAAAGSLGKTLKFVLKGEGVILIDGASVTNEDRPADLTLTASIDDLAALGQGRLAPMAAIMSGR